MVVPKTYNTQGKLHLAQEEPRLCQQTSADHKPHSMSQLSFSILAVLEESYVLALPFIEHIGLDRNWEKFNVWATQIQAFQKMFLYCGSLNEMSFIVTSIWMFDSQVVVLYGEA